MSPLQFLLAAYALAGLVCVIGVLFDRPWRRGGEIPGLSYLARLVLLVLAFLCWPMFAWENRPGRCRSGSGSDL